MDQYMWIPENEPGVAYQEHLYQQEENENTSAEAICFKIES